MMEYGNSVIIPSASEAEKTLARMVKVLPGTPLAGKISWQYEVAAHQFVVWSMILLMMIPQIIPLIC